MPLITHFPSPLRPDDRRQRAVPPGTNVAQWLQRHGGPVNVVWHNGQRVEPEHITLGEGDSVVIRTYPADPVSIGAWFVSALGVSATVGTVLGYATVMVASMALSTLATRLFGPKMPKAFDTPEASPVYGTQAAQNAARLGAPVPVPYGRVWLVPDYAAQPYSEFDGNDQFVSLLMCLGVGEYEVHGLRLGQTPIDTLAPGTVTWRTFSPAEHGQRLGAVRASMGIWENVYTNAQVENLELLGTKEGASSTPSIYWLSNTVREVPGEATGPSPDDLRARATDAVGTLVPGVVFSKRFTANGGWFSTVGDFVAMAYGNGPPSFGYTVVPYPQTGAPGAHWMGAFQTCLPSQKGRRLDLDFVFPNGLFHQDTNNGNFVAVTVNIEVEATPIDDAGADTGAPTAQTLRFSAATNTPQRFTRTITLPQGRYRVRVRRGDDTDPLSGRSTTVDKAIWAGMKFFLDDDEALPAYGAVTLLAVRLKATNGISGSSAGQVRVDATRKLQVLGAGPLVATTNPVDALVDVITAPYGGRRPFNDFEFDVAEFTRSRAKWANTNGFNAVFDRTSSVWDAALATLGTVAAVPLPIGSRLTIAHDCVKDHRIAVFTDNNITPGSLQVVYEFDKVDAPEGVRVEYRDPLTFEPAFVQEPAYSDSVESINLFGCTSRTTAQQYLQLSLNRRRLQRKSITFETELEGLMLRYGDRIAVQHSMPKWGASARVIAFDSGTDTLTLELAPAWGSGTHSAVIRDEFGHPHTVPCSPGALPNQVVLGAPLGFAVWTIADPAEATIVCIAQDPAPTVTDWVVTQMEPQDATVRVQAMAYVGAPLYAGALPHQLQDGAPDPTLP